MRLSGQSALKIGTVVIKQNSRLHSTGIGKRRIAVTILGANFFKAFLNIQTLLLGRVKIRINPRYSN